MKTRQQRNKEKDHLSIIKKKHRKEFFTNLKTVCNLYAGYDLYSKIPAVWVEGLYNSRFHQVSIIADDASHLHPREIKFNTEILDALIKNARIDLPDGKGQIPLGIQLIEGLTLTLYAQNYKDEDFPAAREIRETMHRYLDPDYYCSFSNTVNQTLFILGVLQNHFDEGFISGKYEQVLTKTKTAVKNVFRFYKIDPVKEYFVVDGHTRPAFRVGCAYPNNDMRWAEIKPSQVGLLQNSGDDLPMPVFIQAHALLRLNERMGLTKGMMHFTVFDSINTLMYHRDERDRILIQYNYFKKKAGYLVSSIENNKVLIHTFLFLTNNGTPEGKKLFELTGLQMMDKKYLAIDRLSTFLQYNIKDNALVKNIFEQSGCGQLLEMDDAKQFIQNPTKEASADSIANYLRTNVLIDAIKNTLH